MLPMWATQNSALVEQEEAKNSLPFILHGLHPRPHHDGDEVPRQVVSCWLVLSNSFSKSLPTEKLRYALFTLCTLLLRLLPTSINHRTSAVTVPSIITYLPRIDTLVNLLWHTLVVKPGWNSHENLAHQLGMPCCIAMLYAAQLKKWKSLTEGIASKFQISKREIYASATRSSPTLQIRKL